MFEEETGKYNKILLVIYVIGLAASAMGDMAIFSYSMSRMMKAISLIIVVMAVTVLIISGNLNRVKKASSFVGVYAFVLVGIIVWSIFLWIVNLESIDFIFRGISKFVYQFLVLLVIFSGVYLFGERAIHATFYGLALANAVIMFINLNKFGLPASVESIMDLFRGAEAQQGFAKSMEIHEVTFTFGFFVIYFIFFAKHTRERIADIAIAAFFFMLGWKRIAFAALPVAILAAVIMGLMSPKTRRRFMMVVAWGFVIFSFVYVVATRTGIFEYVTNTLEIDTMGRNEVYSYIEKYYDISLTFIGYGFEYTTVVLQRIMLTEPNAHLGVLALHNNILTEYIELGFVGFWAWLLYTWVFQLRWMLRHWGEKVAMLFFLSEMYIFITYMTDNTLYYYYTSMTLRLMPMAYAFHVVDDSEIKTWPWVKERKPNRLYEYLTS